MQYQLAYSRCLHIRPTMRAISGILLLFTVTCLLWHIIDGCEPGQMQNGCKIYGAVCNCGYGCKSEYMYRTRRACLNALRERSTNICFRQPCLRGICIQTAQEPGFACKCEGTGYYGQRCEKACSSNETHYGCTVKGRDCTCRYGCKDELNHSNKSMCLKYLRKKISKFMGSATSAPTRAEVNTNKNPDLNVSPTMENDYIMPDIDSESIDKLSTHAISSSEQRVPMRMCVMQWGHVKKYP